MHAPHPLYSIAEIRTIEHAAQATLPAFALMQRAGRAAADFALELLTGDGTYAEVLVLAGPGNNGGDALEAASCIARTGIAVTALLFVDATAQPEDARHATENAKIAGVRFASTDAAVLRDVAASTQWTLVIDGLFGIGLHRVISPPLRDLIALVGAMHCPVLALDVPSGLDADTGNIINNAVGNTGGNIGVAIRASHTITFIGDKPGLHTCFGRDYAGEVRVADLDINTCHFRPARAQINTPGGFAESLRPRAHNSHKGSYGDAIVVGGAPGMSGAAILAARSAAKCGAGRVFAAFVESAPAYDSLQPELMCRLAQDIDFSSGTLLVGPGLGTSPAARDLLIRAVDAGTPLVLDADALNMLAVEPALQDKLAGRAQPTLLTPHPLEAARLLGISTAQVQADRLAAARALARRCNAIVILKGSGTIIAQPDGEIAVNTTGNAGLATAGSGDVLAGVCGALLAQSWPAWHAALAAVWLHGHAADLLVEQGVGPIGLTAGELIPHIRLGLNQLVKQYA